MKIRLPGVAVLGATTGLMAVVAAVPAALAGTGCPNTSKGSMKTCVIAHASVTGDYATTVATGHASRPLTIDVLVYTKPSQRVHMAWTMTCKRGLGAGSKSGSFDRSTIPLSITGGTSPTGVHLPWTIHGLRMPMRRPDSCIVSADAQLQRGGRLIVQILAIRR
jgi:hypothetical protein